MIAAIKALDLITFPGCSDQEIRDKATGKVLVSTGAPMPVEPARARVQVTDATYRLSPKPVGAVATYKNHASMPILVKAILYRKGPGSPNAFTKVDERNIHFYPNQTKGVFYGQKTGAFDPIRVALTQQSPVIHCPRNQCVTFPTYEGSFVGQQPGEHQEHILSLPGHLIIQERAIRKSRASAGQRTGAF